MESVAIRDIENMFGYIQALKDVGIISDEHYQNAFKHLWDLRAILNVALNEYAAKNKVTLVKTFDD